MHLFQTILSPAEKAAKHQVPDHRKAANPKKRPVSLEASQIDGNQALYHQFRAYLSSHNSFRAWDPGSISQLADTMVQQWMTGNARPLLPADPSDPVQDRHTNHLHHRTPFGNSSLNIRLVSQGARNHDYQSSTNEPASKKTTGKKRGKYKKLRARATQTPCSALCKGTILEELPPQ